MTGAVGFPVWSTALSPNWRNEVPRVENVRRGKGLKDDAENNDRRRRNRPPESRSLTASRIDTGHAPDRHTPRHSAPFVAQIVGQALGAPAPDASSARVAYSRAPIVLGDGAHLDRSA